MKTFYQFINESKTTKSIVIVDIQSEFKNLIKFDLINFYEFLKENYEFNNIYWVYDVIVSPFDIYNMVEFFMDDLYDEDLADEIFSFFKRINIVEKTYGFFRSVMDEYSIDDAIKLAQEMYKNNISDVEDIEDEILNIDEDIIEYAKENTFYIPKIHELEHLENVDICGGGDDECLDEIEIYLELYNIKYDRLNNWIYRI